MRNFIYGFIAGCMLVGLCGITPTVKASEDDFKAPHTYKEYLMQMLAAMKQVNDHLSKIEANTGAIKDKIHA